VEEVEGDALGAGGSEELDRNGRKPEMDIEILQRARHGFSRYKGGLVFCRMYIDHNAARRSSSWRSPKPRKVLLTC
jgi:hypothetical protein